MSLPAEPNAFIGRREAVRAVASLLREHPLVTLVGPGGCGKTRLALRVAAPDAYFVDLSPLAHGDFVAAAVADALGYDAHPKSALDVLAQAFAGSSVLIVLDNCEHVVDDVARLCDRLVRSAPLVRMLATSRERLGVAGEVAYPVPPLEPVEAVELFVERARRARPGFTLQDTESVARICRGVDGLPLAIELAAASVRLMSPAAIADGLSALLDGGPRTAAPRHRNFRACVDWSHDLLQDEERTVFRRLGVFINPFELGTAEAVVGEPDVRRVLAQLVDKSLVTPEPDRDRYRLLATLREYAHEQLELAGELKQTRAAHRDAFVALVESVYPVPWRGEDEAVRALVPVIDDVLAAFAWSEERGDADDMCRLCPALMPLLRRNHRAEAAQIAARAGDALQDASVHRRAALVAARAPWPSGWYPQVPLEHATEAADYFASLGDARNQALAMVAAVKAGAGPDTATAALGMARAARDPVVETTALWSLVSVEELSDGTAATAHATAAVDVAYCESAAFGNASAWQLIRLLDRHGHHLAAMDAARALLARPDEGGSMRWRADGHRALLLANLAAPGDVARRAEGLMAMYENRTTPLALRPDLLDCLIFTMQGIAAHVSGDLRAAERWYRRAQDGIVAGPEADYGWRAVLVWRLWCHLGLGDYDEALRDAAALRDRPFGGPAEIDYTLVAGAVSARANGDRTTAESLAHELLPTAARARRDDVVATLLELLGGLRGGEDGVRLLGAAHALREATGARLRLPPHDAWYESDLARLGGASGRAWDEGATFDLARAVAYARRGRGERGRPSTGWASLTPAECSVVDLVVAGLSNQQVAQRLYISTRTVASHLRRVFAKLDVTSRTQLAAIALRSSARAPREDG